MVHVKYFFKKLPTDAREIEILAEKLGVTLFGTGVSGGGITGTDVYEVERRIREALSDARNSWLWLLAIASAMASVFSALAAWRAALCK